MEQKKYLNFFATKSFFHAKYFSFDSEKDVCVPQTCKVRFFEPIDLEGFSVVVVISKISHVNVISF